MTRLHRQALLAGYSVSLVVVLLAVVAAFGHLGPREVAAAALLAVPVTALGARMICSGLDADGDPVDQVEGRPAPVG